MKTKKWEHYRAMIDWKVLIVLDKWDWYEVCWPRECWVPYDDVEIISRIKRPKKIDKEELYYF